MDHLKLAEDLSTDSFILLLRRFISRRGHVKIMKSHNGKNFVGAGTELKERLRILDQIKVENFLRMKDIKWRFNLPLCPWMGGSWEPLIKSIKRSLESITNGRTITEELLITLLCEVMSILNSRPLTSTSDEITDFEVLTPNLILLGSS